MATRYTFMLFFVGCLVLVRRCELRVFTSVYLEEVSALCRPALNLALGNNN